MIDYLVSVGGILSVWAVAALCKRHASNKSKLQAMSDDELIEQMNYTNHYDNKYRKEYYRRHPIMGFDVKSIEGDAV